MQINSIRYILIYVMFRHSKIALTKKIYNYYVTSALYCTYIDVSIVQVIIITNIE